MSIHEIQHPLVKHKLGLMRNANISTRDFRQLTHELGVLLTYEATRDLPLVAGSAQAWKGNADIEFIEGKKITLAPILRAGLGMLSGVLEVIPNAKVSVIGIYRDKETLAPVPYFEKLATDMPKRTALILDPMLATGGSLLAGY
jgi:uracil phosphoribosyltransferase